VIGKTVSHYKIFEKLGAGGMGEVYKAEDLKLNRTVALKFLPVHLVEDVHAKERFIHEAQATAALQHPNIAVIYDFIESEDETVIVMEYLEGETLAQKIKLQNANLKQIMDWMIGISSGLAAAHEKGITHRDIKPENIMITRSSLPKIMDFGVAKLRGTPTLTDAGSRIGTLDYAAPETVMGSKSDHRSDIFSLGVVLYELLTGQRPFHGDHDAAVVYAIVNEKPKPLTYFQNDIPTDLEQLVMKMLEKKKENRYQSINKLLTDLRDLQKSINNDQVSLGNNKDGKKIKHQNKDLKIRRKESVEDRQSRVNFLQWKRYYIFAAVVILLILIIWTGIRLIPGSNKTIDSIAVLPLENLSGDPEQEYFVSGMTDALITNLAKIRALKVISKTSVMHYQDTDKSLPEIAQELNVDAILEGSVLRAGNGVRITAQLIEGATDRHLWAESYERDLHDVLAMQSEVAQAIVREIKLTLTPQEQVRLLSTRSVNPEAYEAYLKGCYFWDKHSEDGLRKSFQYFEEAIKKDSTYANAYAGLAESYIMLGSPGLEVLPPSEIKPKARKAAMQALKLDDLLAEAHAALGSVKLTYDWDWTGAEREFKRAIELNPSYAMAYLYYSSFFTMMGRHEEAIAAIKRALELDPLSLTINVVMGNQFYHARQYDQAIEHHLNTLDMNPNNEHAHWSLGFAYVQKGMFNKAIAEMEKAVTLSKRNVFVLSMLGWVYGLSGRKDDAMNILDEVMEQTKQRYVSPFAIAMIHIGLGNKDQVFQWLEKARKEHSTTMAWLRVDATLDSFRSDPRFTELLKKMGLDKSYEQISKENYR
jgi:serine/threonine protein kinase/Tfp pilus assembly protein PilF